MFLWVYDVVLLFSTLVFAAAATGAAYALLRHFNVVDTPNARSNHSVPTPRGGGIGMIFAMLCFLLVVETPGALVWGVLLLAALSFLDDLRPLPAKHRLLGQVVIVGWLLLSTYQGALLDGALPRWVELPLLALAWLWFINLFNFMDGSDGLAGSEAACISVGLLMLGVVYHLPSHAFTYALVSLGAALGFLLWNWQPAKVFMGDVGSIPMGFLLGFMLISLAGAGHVAPALILPAYFVADASLTLLRRALKRERIFEAHSSHAYQRAIRAGMPHEEVARNVIGVNLLLVILAVLTALHEALWWQSMCLLLAYALAFGLIVYFTSTKRRVPAQAAGPDITEAEVVEEIPASGSEPV